MPPVKNFTAPTGGATSLASLGYWLVAPPWASVSAAGDHLKAPSLAGAHPEARSRLGDLGRRRGDGRGAAVGVLSTFPPVYKSEQAAPEAGVGTLTPRIFPPLAGSGAR